MNWIERIFDLNLDGDSGAVEIAILLSICLLIVLATRKRVAQTHS